MANPAMAQPATANPGVPAAVYLHAAQPWGESPLPDQLHSQANKITSCSTPRQPNQSDGSHLFPPERKTLVRKPIAGDSGTAGAT